MSFLPVISEFNSDNTSEDDSYLPLLSTVTVEDASSLPADLIFVGKVVVLLKLGKTSCAFLTSILKLISLAFSTPWLKVKMILPFLTG